MSSAPFCGRDAELESLLGLWQQVCHGHGPQAAVILAESGLGKTRLAHEFYARLVQQAQNEAEPSYWPYRLGSDGNNLQVNPDASACIPSVPLPFLWWGIRLVDPLSRNCVAAGVLSSHFERDLQPHLEASYRVQRKKERTAGTLKLGASTLFDVAVDVASSVVPIVGVAKKVGEVALDLKEVYKGANNDRAPIDMQRLRDNKQATLNEKIIGDLTTFFAQHRDDPIPLIVLIDDAQFSEHDPGIAVFLQELITAASDKRWPLLVIVSHWEREWHEGRTAHDATIAGVVKQAESSVRMPVRLLALRPIGDLSPVLRSALPGLSQPQIDALLERVGGNPRFLDEIIRFAMSPRARSLFERRDVSAPLTEKGFDELLHRSVALHDLIAERLANSPEIVQQAVALASLQGVEFSRRLVGNTGQQLDTDGEALTMAVSDAESPHAYVSTVEAGLAAFAQRIYYEVARDHLPACFDPDEAMHALMDSIRHLARSGEFSSLNAEERYRFMALAAGLFEMSETLEDKQVACWALANLIDTANVNVDIFGSYALAKRLAVVAGQLPDDQLDGDLVWLDRIYSSADGVSDRQLQSEVGQRMVRLTGETYDDDANAWSAWMYAKALVTTSGFHAEVHDIDRVIEHLAEAHRVLSEWVNDDMDLHQLSTWEDVLHGLARCLIQRGSFADAVPVFQDLVVLSDRIERAAPNLVLGVYCRARALSGLGRMFGRLRQMEQATEALTESLELTRRVLAVAPIGEVVDLFCTTAFALTYWQEQNGHADAALALLNETVDVTQQLMQHVDIDGHRTMVAQALVRRGRLWQRLDNRDDARRDALQALGLYEQTMETVWPPYDGLGMQYEQLSSLEAADGNLEQARSYASEACRWLRLDVARTAEPDAVARLLIALVTQGEIERQAGNTVAVQELIAEARVRMSVLPESYGGMLDGTRERLNALMNS